MGPTERRRFSATKLVNAGKFAVEFALSQVGLQVNDIVKGEVKKNVVMVEEMNHTRQQNRASTDRNEDEGEERLKRLFDEPLNNATPHTKIFIRSRL